MNIKSKGEVIAKYVAGTVGLLILLFGALQLAEPGIEFALTCEECFAPDDSIITLMSQPFWAILTIVCLAVSFWVVVVSIALPSFARDALKKTG